MDAISLTTVARFWSKVEVGSPTACWNWRGGSSDFGHGRFKIDGRLILPHRFVYEQAHGPIPEHDSYHGLVVMHACDNPLCCNPAHLRLGTQHDNVRDQIDKGRKPRGGRYTDAKVDAIRRDPRPYKIVAEAHGVSRNYVGKIKRGEIRAA